MKLIKRKYRELLLKISVSVFCALILHENPFSQVVKAIYQCNYYSNPQDNSMNDLGFTISMKIIYTVFADTRFVEITGKLEDATTIAGADIHYKDKNERVIADIKNKLIYFQDERILKTIKGYKMVADEMKVTADGFHLINSDTTIRVKLKKNTTVPITPGLFIEDSNGLLPIECIKTPKMDIKLISVEIVKDKKLNFDELFKKLQHQKPDGYFDFLQK